jgi:disulfide bond formation protein DsbB
MLKKCNEWNILLFIVALLFIGLILVGTYLKFEKDYKHHYNHWVDMQEGALAYMEAFCQEKINLGKLNSEDTKIMSDMCEKNRHIIVDMTPSEYAKSEAFPLINIDASIYRLILLFLILIVGAAIVIALWLKSNLAPKVLPFVNLYSDVVGRVKKRD